MNKQDYLLFNKILLLIVGGSILYYILFQPTLVCIHVTYLGKECNSCGITRDFLAFMKGDFINPINLHSLPLFVLLILQVIYRITIVSLPKVFKSQVIFYDIAISGIMFLYLIFAFR